MSCLTAFTSAGLSEYFNAIAGLLSTPLPRHFLTLKSVGLLLLLPLQDDDETLVPPRLPGCLWCT